MSSDQVSRDEILNSDVAVIGGGGTGLAAAASAAEKGAKVILLEKRGLGGNSALANGLFAADSELQRSMRIDVQKDELFKRAMEYAHWKTNPRIIRAFINKSGDTIHWLGEKGINFDRVLTWCPGQYPPHWHCAGPMGTGAKIVKALHKSCEDLGVQVFTRYPAKRILTDRRGSVTGVLAATKGKELRINARSVIIATGGYGGNKRLLKKYSPYYGESMYHVGVPHMGDGLLMATEIGAATEGLGILLLHPPEFPRNRYLTDPSKRHYAIWVNKRGERFADETIAKRVPECANVVARQVDGQPEKCIYVLFDEKMKHRIIEEATADSARVVAGAGPWAGLDMANLEKELQSEAKKGGVKISDSWDEIANWMGAVPEVLRATIEEYNSSCDRGYDEVFAKDRRYLQALRTPRYYAVKCYHTFLTTIGGIKINHRMEVLDGKGNPIPGLFAGGDTTGGWETDTYSVVLGGGAFGFAINSGRIAGENSAEYTLGR